MKNKLEMMSTAQLEELLRSELDKGRDRKKVMQILRILEERDSYNSIIITEATERRPRKWLPRVVAIAAALAILIVTIPPALGAENIVEILGRWSRDIFSYFTPDEEEYVYETDHPGLQQLYDTLQEHGATERCVPTWLPEGYELVDINVFQQRVSTKVSAQFVNDDGFVVITYEVHNEATSNNYPKDGANIEVFEREGIRHYIVSNDGDWAGTWNTRYVECSIMTNHDREMLRKILTSIYAEV